MKSYLIYYAIFWVLGIILMGLFVRMRAKRKMPPLDDPE